MIYAGKTGRVSIWLIDLTIFGFCLEMGYGPKMLMLIGNVRINHWNWEYHGAPSRPTGAWPRDEMKIPTGQVV